MRRTSVVNAVQYRYAGSGSTVRPAVRARSMRALSDLKPDLIATLNGSATTWDDTF
jgi:hypothetical protein